MVLLLSERHDFPVADHLFDHARHQARIGDAPARIARGTEQGTGQATEQGTFGKRATIITAAIPGPSSAIAAIDAGRLLPRSARDGVTSRLWRVGCQSSDSNSK